VRQKPALSFRLSILVADSPIGPCLLPNVVETGYDRKKPTWTLEDSPKHFLNIGIEGRYYNVQVLTDTP